MAISFHDTPMDQLKSIHFPTKSGYVVIAFNGECTSSDSYGQRPLFLWPSFPTITSAGRVSGLSLGSSTPIFYKGKLVAQPYEPYRLDRFDTFDSSTWDYQSSTVYYGIRGSPFPRGSFRGNGAHTSDVFLDAQQQMVIALSAEFGWDSTYILNNTNMLFEYSYLVEIGAAPPNQDPAAYTDAVTTKIDATLHSLEIFKRTAVIIDIGNANNNKKAKTFTITIDNPGFGLVAHINTFQMWTYKKKIADKFYDLSPPNGWNITEQEGHDPINYGLQRNVVVSHLYDDDSGNVINPLDFTEEPFIQNSRNIDFPALAVDFCDVSGIQFTEGSAGDPGCTIRAEIDLKTLAFKSVTRTPKG